MRKIKNQRNDNITIHEFPHAINTFEIIDRKPELGEDLDFSWDEVDNFIIENGLSYDDVYFYRNWAVNNEGKLRLIDYSR